jgi:hypothetical protein
MKFQTPIGFRICSPLIISGWLACTGCFRSEAQSPEPSSIQITEILASNIGTHWDEKGEDDDWIELFNPGKSTVNIGGMYLSDDPTNPLKFRIPQDAPEKTSIPPESYLVLWFDGQPEQGPLHTDMKLSSSGEHVILTASDGTTLVDSVEFGEQRGDVSYGRDPNASQNWHFFTSPTPGEPNILDEPMQDITPPPAISHDEGFYSTPIEVSLKSEPNTTIYYTLNGADPDESNRLTYNTPLTITTNTVLRTLTKRPSQLESETLTRTYFIGEKSTLSIVSLVIDPYWLYDEDDGIYTNWEEEWEVPGHLSFFETDQEQESAFESYLGVSISGNSTKAYPKKSFSLRFRKGWGKSSIKYPLWETKPHVKQFDGLTLRADMAGDRISKNPVSGERIKNELIYEFAHALKSSTDVQAYRPVSLFLNGQYWGIYNLMERKGIDFIRENHGVDDLDMLSEDKGLVAHGDDDHFERLRTFATTSDPSSDEFFPQINQWMDISSFIDYWVFECYCGAHDHNVNIRYWRPRTTDGKWRWISFDTDSWREWDHDIFDYYSTEDKQPLLFLDLLKNETFSHLFANRMCDMLNTVMSPENTRALIGKITQRIEPEIDRERTRWESEHQYVEKGSEIKRFTKHAKKRPRVLRKTLLEHLGLKPKTFDLTVKVTGNGTIRINTIHPRSYPWTGVYMKKIPVTLEAIPQPGATFTGWSLKEFGTDPIITIDGKKELEIIARFD